MSPVAGTASSALSRVPRSTVTSIPYSPFASPSILGWGLHGIHDGWGFPSIIPTSHPARSSFGTLAASNPSRPSSLWEAWSQPFKFPIFHTPSFPSCPSLNSPDSMFSDMMTDQDPKVMELIKEAQAAQKENGGQVSVTTHKDAQGNVTTVIQHKPVSGTATEKGVKGIEGSRITAVTDNEAENAISA